MVSRCCNCSHSSNDLCDVQLIKYSRSIYRYTENVVAKLLGFSENTPLSHSEWKRIRRKRKVAPRRFSKRFIVSQLEERNDYRSKVRQIQINPSAFQDFPYDVYMPNKIGSMVTAYCKRYHVLQRGSVLAFFPKKAMYLIEFENVHFGYEYCPDSDVASCGVPTRVVPSSCVTRQHSRFVSHFEQGIVWLNKLAQYPCSRSAVSTSTTPPTSSSLKTFVDEVANYDSFLSLLEMMDVARSRKHELLSLVEDANTLAITALPFGQADEAFGGNGTTVESVKLSQSTKDHLHWLINSLQRTNLVLDASVNTFRTLYGGSFVPYGALHSSKIDHTEFERLMEKAEAVLAGS
jgi:DIRP